MPQRTCSQYVSVQMQLLLKILLYMDVATFIFRTDNIHAAFMECKKSTFTEELKFSEMLDLSISVFCWFLLPVGYILGQIYV